MATAGTTRGFQLIVSLEKEFVMQIRLCGGEKVSGKNWLLTVPNLKNSFNQLVA
jgi:hypothetical protein